MKLKILIINTLALLCGLCLLASVVGFALGICWNAFFEWLGWDGYNCRYTWLGILIVPATGLGMVLLLRQLLTGKWGR